MITIDQAQFFTNLRLTQAYCEHQLGRKEQVEWTGLRSTINPVYQDGQCFAHMPGVIGEKPIPWDEWTMKSDPYYHDSFIDLFRRQLAVKRSLSSEMRHDEVCSGKILVIEYGQNIPDGAVEPATEGFFDEWDLPPIATWFYNDYSTERGGILFAWIPVKFVELADKAVAIQFLNILSWFEKPRNWVT